MRNPFLITAGLVALVLVVTGLSGFFLFEQAADFVAHQTRLQTVRMDDWVRFLSDFGWQVFGLVASLSLALMVIPSLLVMQLARQAGSARLGAASEIDKFDLAAHRDPLTELPNRFALLLMMEQSRQRAQTSREGCFAVCHFDLDGFTTVNEKYGREFGDRLLKSVASRVRAIARQGDYLARFQDDSFVLVVHGLANIWEMEPVLSRLMHVSATPVAIGNTQFRFSFSVGVTLYPRDPVGAEELIAHAGEAMRQSRESGGTRWTAWQPIANAPDADPPLLAD